MSWLLLLVIPLQGIAAAALLTCAPSQNGTTTRLSQPSVHQQQASRAEQQSDQHHGAAPCASHAQSDAAVAQNDASIPADLPTNSSCSACASCCTTAALVNTLLVSPASKTGPVITVFTVEFFLSHIPKGFDPPPRATLV